MRRKNFIFIKKISIKYNIRYHRKVELLEWVSIDTILNIDQDMTVLDIIIYLHQNIYILTL